MCIARPPGFNLTTNPGSSMKLPKLDDFYPEQWAVYNQIADTSQLIAGPPGSGKTSLAVHCATQLAELGRQVAVVTRNRMLAASAMRSGGRRFDATTMHKLVPKDYTRRCHKWLTTFDWPWDEIEAGCASGASKPPPFDHLIIDEGQDLPPPFFRWAKNYGARNLTIFADEDQSIGSPTDNSRSTLRDIAAATGLVNMHVLTHNFRNTPEIAAVAEHFHDGTLEPAVVVRRRSGDVPRIVRATTDQVAEMAVTRLANRAEPIGVVVPTIRDAKSVHTSIRARAPTAAQVMLYTSESEAGDEDAIDLTAAGITVLTGESVKGLEFACVYLLDLRRSLPCGSGDVGTANRRRLYMLCSRAQDTLVLVEHPTPLSAAQRADLPAAPTLQP